MKYKTPAEAGIAGIPPAPKRKPYRKQHARRAPSERYLIRLKKGQTIADYMAARRAEKEAV